MKVLLDECVPERLRQHIPGHEVHSTRYAGLTGRKNGELLRMATEAGYEVLITVDQGIPYQQSLPGVGMALIVLAAPGNDIETLKRMVDAIVRSLESAGPGKIIKLDYATA